MRARILLAPPLLAALCAMTGADARAESWRFEWTGAGGYRMTGAFAIDGARTRAERVSGDDLACFVIQGYRDAEPIGVWRLSELTPATYWNFSFEPSSGRIPVGGLSFSGDGQEWNMSGAGDGCGVGGFGFNAGNAAQDLCVDDAWVAASSRPADQPFEAVRDDTVRFAPDDCRDAALLSMLSR